MKGDHSMNPLIFSPSILSMDYAHVNEQLKELQESGAKWLHFDVMDGHFVPNLTFGPDILSGFRKAVDLFMDVHLMVEHPKQVAQWFLSAGADLITFHIEAMKDMEDCLALCDDIHAFGKQAGISVKPHTDVKPLLPYLDRFDLVLIMSVEPGFGGQSFMEDVLTKVKLLRKEMYKKQLSTRLQIDGGIHETTGKLAVEAGCDTLVAGSYVFKNGIKDAVETLLCLKK